MSRMVSARELIGKKIAGFDPGTWTDTNGRVKHNPKITLDDGSVLVFTVEESEHGNYGVFIGRWS